MTPEGPLLTVTPRYARTHLVGGTFSNAFGSMVVRGEAGYFINRPLISRGIVDNKSFLPVDQFRHVVGLDWFKFSETLISVQVFQDWTPNHSPLLFADRLTTSVSGLLRRDFLNQTLTPEFLLVQNTTCGSVMARPRIKYAMDDHTTLRLGADVFYGNQNCDFGQFAERDRVVLGVSWAF